MEYHWLGKSKSLLLGSLALVLALAIACGAAATATPVPPTSAPASTAPTAVPAPTVGQVPTVEAMGAGKVTPAFADYWQPPTDFYGEPVYGGHVRINYEDPLEHANSWGARTGAATRLRSATMNHIVNLSPWDNTKIIPDLAEGWTQEEDGSGITFHFAEGIEWHNGEAFTCEDARFTMETWITGNGITASAQKANFAFIDVADMECGDDLTLKIKFKAPTAPALLAFTDPNAFIFNKAWFEAGGEDAMFQDVSVGTGPFTSGQKATASCSQYTGNCSY